MCLALPGKIINISNDKDEFKEGKVNFNGIERLVNLSYVPEAKINDYVIVHAGFAISIVDQEEAKDIIKKINELNKAQRWSF